MTPPVTPRNSIYVLPENTKIPHIPENYFDIPRSMSDIHKRIQGLISRQFYTPWKEVDPSGVQHLADYLNGKTKHNWNIQTNSGKEIIPPSENDAIIFSGIAAQARFGNMNAIKEAHAQEGGSASLTDFISTTGAAILNAHENELSSSHLSSCIHTRSDGTIWETTCWASWHGDFRIYQNNITQYTDITSPVGTKSDFRPLIEKREFAAYHSSEYFFLEMVLQFAHQQGNITEALALLELECTRNAPCYKNVSVANDGGDCGYNPGYFSGWISGQENSLFFPSWYGGDMNDYKIFLGENGSLTMSREISGQEKICFELFPTEIPQFLEQFMAYIRSWDGRVNMEGIQSFLVKINRLRRFQ